jgi:hypothetical protein
MNVFTTDVFLDTAGAVFFPGQHVEKKVFRVDGRLLRLLVVEGRIISRMPFYDFPQPLDAWDGDITERWFFPRTVVRTTPARPRRPEPAEHLPSPYINWPAFSTWEAFERHVESSDQPKTNDTKRQRRRLERDVGPLSFLFDDRRPEVFEACIRWKAAQYVSTGVGNLFSSDQNVELFRQLHRAGAVAVSSLSAGGELVAAHIGSLTHHRFGWWVPAYDASRAKYSPGRLLLDELLRASYQRGDIEFDFLIGDEPYKFLFATHNRVIGPIGAPPLTVLVDRVLREPAQSLLRENPRVYAMARSVRRALFLR